MRPINLLPPEIARRAESRRKVAGLIALGVLYLLVLAVVSYWWSGKQRDMEAELTAQRQINEATQRQINALAGAKDLRDGYDAGVARVEGVLARDIAWAKILNDLARVIPDRVWLNSFTGTSIENEETPAVYGQVQVNATAFDYPDASTWLRVLDSDVWPAMGGGWVTAAQRSAIGEVPVVTFQSVASLTGASISRRVENRIPEVPE